MAENLDEKNLIDPETLDATVRALKKMQKDADKISLVKSTAAAFKFESGHAAAIIEAVRYLNPQLEAGILLLPHVTDREQWHVALAKMNYWE